MKRRTRSIRLCILIAMLVPTSARSAFGWPTPSFMGLGDLPGGNFESWARAISADGSTVVGEGNSDAGVEAFRWTVSEGMMGLGDLTGGSFFSRAFGTSADGSVIVGGSNSGIGREAFRWTPSAGMDHLSGGMPGSDALATSADGSVIVGVAGGGAAFRWTPSGGMALLGDLAGGGIDSYASGVSSNGSIIVGQGNSGQGYQAFRWTQTEGMVGLGTLPGSGVGAQSRATAISGDGNVIVGIASSATSPQGEAFRWTADLGMVALGRLARGGLSSTAFAVSADGSVIAGQATDEDENAEAFIWDDAHGMRSLFDVLTIEFDLDLSNWSLDNVAGVSADGMTIVGSGYGPEGYQAWIASIPEPATLLLFAIGLTLCRHRTLRAVHDWMYRAS